MLQDEMVSTFVQFLPVLTVRRTHAKQYNKACGAVLISFHFPSAKVKRRNRKNVLNVTI